MLHDRMRTYHTTKRAHAGFSMVEMLAALIVVGLVGTAVIAGIPAAQRAYEASMDASNAQLMVSTATTNLRDALSVADLSDDVIVAGDSDPLADPDSLVQFTSFETGLITSLKNTEEGLKLVELDPTVANYSSDTPVMNETPIVPLAIGKGARDDLRIYADSIEWDSTAGVFTIDNIYVTRSDDGEGIDKALAKAGPISVRVLVPPSSS